MLPGDGLGLMQAISADAGPGGVDAPLGQPSFLRFIQFFLLSICTKTILAFSLLKQLLLTNRNRF